MKKKKKLSLFVEQKLARKKKLYLQTSVAKGKSHARLKASHQNLWQTTAFHQEIVLFEQFAATYISPLNSYANLSCGAVPSFFTGH